VLRSYVKYGSKEITIWINPENEITTAIRSMSNNKPADEYIQAIEDCELVVIPFEAMQEIYERFPEMNMVGRKLLEEYYAASEERVYICRIPDARSRYQHFMETRQELVNRIPLKYIASYLGITLETLSRLRAKNASRRA
jgi:CRP-like cAMP-binding protein